MTGLTPTQATVEATGGAERVSGGQGSNEGADGPHRAWTLTIPAPTDWISANKRHHRMVKANLTKAWRNAARIAARDIPPLTPPVRIIAHIWKPRNGRYDPNNLADTSKACVDGLVDAGVLPDDSYREVIGPDHRHGGKGPAALVLEIREITGISGKMKAAPEVLETPPGA